MSSFASTPSSRGKDRGRLPTRGRMAPISSKNSSPNPCRLPSYQATTSARPELPTRTGLESLSRTGNAFLDPRPRLVPAQTRKAADGGLGATLHLGNPRLSIARLDVRLEACQELRRHRARSPSESWRASLSTSSALMAIGRSLPPFVSHARARSGLAADRLLLRMLPWPRAQPGAQENGIHEVRGSIPLSSTNSSNSLAGRGTISVT
jgi:hypothetical protein